MNFYGKLSDAKDSLVSNTVGKKEENGCFPKLTFKQRLYGWFSCVLIGIFGSSKIEHRLCVGYFRIRFDGSAKSQERDY